jgi:hypothetical protein
MTVVRPPRSWEIQTAVVIGAVAAVGLFGIVLFVRDLALRDYVLTGGVNGLSPMVAAWFDRADRDGRTGGSALGS